MSEKKKANVAQVRAYFGMSSREVLHEWRQITDDEKNEIKELVAAEIDG